MRIVKKIIRIFAIIIVSILLLNVILFLTFSIPSVQKYAADFALGKLKPKLNTEMSIDKIRIKLFNTVEIGGLYVEDQKKDTLLFADKLSARVNIWNLLDNQLSVESVRLENFAANIYRQSPDSAFNFQFIIDAFASTDTVKKAPSENPLQISINDIKLKNGTLRYDILSEPETPSYFNPSHFFVKDFQLDASIASLDMKRLVADINTLSFDEQKAGVKVDDLQGMVRSENTKMWSDKLTLTLNNSDLKVTHALYDTETKEFALTAKSDKIDPKDAAIFSDRLTHLNKPFSFEADLVGKIPEAEIKNLTARYGNQTAFTVKGLISDFSKYGEADLNIDVPAFHMSVQDLRDFIRIGTPDFELPEQLSAMENIDLNLKAKGKLSNFNIAARVKTAPGIITFDGKGGADSTFENIHVDGRLLTNNLQVAKIIGPETGVDDLSLNSLVEVSMKKSQSPVVSVNGNIGSVLYNGYQYKDLAVNATYKESNVIGTVFTDTPNNKLNLHADLSFGNQMKFDVDGTIDKLFLTPLFIVEGWENPYLTTRINAKLQGTTIDDLVGTVVIDSTSLYDANFIYNPGPIYLQALAADAAGDKKIQILSSIIEGEISGDYHFATIGNELMSAMHQHLPTLIKSPAKKTQQRGKNIFNFNILLKNTEDISYALSLPFINVEPATITGTVDMVNAKSAQLNAHIPRLMFAQNDIRESKIDVNLGELSGARVNANTYLVQEDGHINARLNTSVINDSVSNNLYFNVNNNVAKADGSLNVSMGFSRDMADNLVSNISINPTNTLFNGKTISFSPATVVYEKDKITVNDFEVRENQMLLLGIDGIASKSREDAIRAFFNNTEIETILAAFNVTLLKGSINGGVTINQALADPLIKTDNFRIENIRTQTDTLGTLAIDGNWDVVKKGLSVNANLSNKGNNYLNVDGFVPTGDTNPMDVSLKINQLPLAWVQPFAVSTFSQLSGTINSNLKISGKTNAPVTEGWLGVNDGVMTVAFTNVTYKISDTINISPSTIGLNNLVIRDNDDHVARLNLTLSHNNFDGMTYGINMHMNDFLLLNNEKRTDEIAYGTLRLSGDININGSASGIYGNANLKNESRSNVMIELPQTAQATEYSGIIYINTPQQADSLSFLRRRDVDKTNSRINTRLSSGIPINIQAVINVNPLLRAGVVINPTTGDALEIDGTGQIRANYDSRAVPSVRLYGDYIAEEGKFKYNVQGLKTIDFNIREGSTVTLVGDPMNTQFNITAYNQVNADLATLSPEFTTQLTNTRTAVNATLEIQGNLEQMKLNYGIELPDVPNDVRQRLNSLISTDEQKNRQFASLILTGGFYSAEGTSGVDLGSSTTSFVTGQLTKGLDALLAGVLHDNWTINTNLQSRDGTFENMRMGVDLSTRLLDDRLRITTNLSYGDNATLASQQPFMGEFELEYDIKNWLMIRVYNRANQRFTKLAPTTQGAGIVVTKDARNFKDLFKFSLRKKEEER